jgi:hypothetical protein
MLTMRFFKVYGADMTNLTTLNVMTLHLHWRNWIHPPAQNEEVLGLGVNETMWWVGMFLISMSRTV